MPLLWNHYQIEMRVDRLVAGLPANKRMLEAWLAASGIRASIPATVQAQLPGDEPIGPEAIQADLEPMLDQIDPGLVNSRIFYRDLDGQPCYEARCLMGAFKEAGNVLKASKSGEGFIKVANYRAKLVERLVVRAPRLHPITSGIQVDERPISVMTAQGPRTSIKRFEFADDVHLAFELMVLRDGVVQAQHLKDILEWLQHFGIGSDRSQGVGTFELLSFQEIGS